MRGRLCVFQGTPQSRTCTPGTFSALPGARLTKAAFHLGGDNILRSAHHRRACAPAPCPAPALSKPRRVGILAVRVSVALPGATHAAGVAGVGCQGSAPFRGSALGLPPLASPTLAQWGYPVNNFLLLFLPFSVLHNGVTIVLCIITSPAFARCQQLPAFNIFVLSPFFRDLSGFNLWCYPYIPPFFDGA